MLVAQQATSGGICHTWQANSLLARPAKTMTFYFRRTHRVGPPSRPQHSQPLATSAPAKMLKETSVYAGKEAHYDSRCSNPGKEAQRTSTPRFVCRRIPAHGLYFRAASASIKAPIRAMVATILTRSVCHWTAARMAALALPSVASASFQRRLNPGCPTALPARQ